MKNFICFIFLFILSFVSGNEKCEKLLSFGPNEKAIILELENNIGLYRNELSCIEIFIRRGYYFVAESFLANLQKYKINYQNHLKTALENINKELDLLENKFRFDENEYKIVSPAFMWAQSLSNVYILIKFAHSHDSPGCLEVKNQEIKFTTNNLHFIGYCLQGDTPIKFVLDLNLNGEIVEEESNWNSSSVGRLQLNLKKKNAPKYWKNLMIEGENIPKNSKIWSDMKEKFKNELENYESD